MQFESAIKTLSVLGSTGSIGTSTLDVVARHPDKYRIVALTAYQKDELLFEQCLRFKPRFAVMIDVVAASRLTERIAAAGLDQGAVR
jgi:1-deoxy-D-xylulose-5-phosphate reductoisomerase